MEQVVYIDSLFAVNFAVNYLLLLSAARFSGAPMRRGRIAVGAGLGALYAVAVYLPGFGFLGGFGVKAGLAALMALIAYGLEGGWKPLLKRLLVFWGVSFALAGAVMAA